MDLSTGYPNTYFSWFSGTTQLTLVFCLETMFGYFPEVPVTKIRVSAPAPEKNPTVIWVDSECADCPGFLFFWVLLLPRPPRSSWSVLGLAFCFMGPWTFAWIGCPQLPHHPYKNGTQCCSTGGHTPMRPSQWARRGILMSRNKKCRETAFVSQLSRNYPHCGGAFEREKMPSLVGERQFGRHFRRQFGRGYLQETLK